MTDRQAKASGIIAARKMQSAPESCMYYHWMTAFGRVAYTFDGKMPQSRLRRGLALSLAIVGYLVGDAGWFWAWQILTRLKWNVADARIPFFKAWNIRSRRPPHTLLWHP